MKTRLIALVTVLACSGTVIAADQAYPRVQISTNMGDIVVLLDRPRAPLTVENFLTYVADGHYDGTIFHRVVPDFVIQGGGYDTDFELRPTRDNIINESGNGLSNARGTIAMARFNDPHTASSQWFINLVDNERLDPNPRRWGYAVFGRVESGMEVVDAIGALETGPGGPLPEQVPQRTVIVHSVEVLPD